MFEGLKGAFWGNRNKLSRTGLIAVAAMGFTSGSLTLADNGVEGHVSVPLGLGDNAPHLSVGIALGDRSTGIGETLDEVGVVKGDITGNNLMAIAVGRRDVGADISLVSESDVLQEISFTPVTVFPGPASA